MVNGEIRKSDFIVQLQTFNFQLDPRKNLTKYHHLFAEGIKRWANHELIKAKNAFEQIDLADCSAELAHYTPVALLSVLLALEDYDEIKRLELENYEFVDASELALALAFQQFPQEKYLFSNTKNTFNFEFSLTGCPLIEVEINGISRNLWLDTGATTSVLARSTAQECGIESTSSPLTATADNTQFEVRAEAAYAKSLAVGNLKIEHHPLIIIADEMLQLPDPKTKTTRIIDGIIGWNAIRNMDLMIDHKGRNIRIRKPVSKAVQKRNMFTAIRPIVNLQTTDQKILRFGLDTGAGFSSVCENGLAANDLAKVERETVKIATVGGTKQIQTRHIFNQKFSVHNDMQLLFEKLKVVRNLDDWATFFQIDGVLGGDVLKELVLKIDSFNGMIEVETLDI